MADSIQLSEEDKRQIRLAKKAAQMRAARAADPEKARAKDRAKYEANKEKLLKKNKAWRDKNKETLRRKARERRVKNLDRERARTRAWIAANKDRKMATDRAYSKANKEIKAAKQRQRYRSNKEAILARNKAWCEANKESRRPAIRAYAAKRRAANHAVVLMDRARARVYSALLRQNVSKSQRTITLVGCTPSFLRAWIESKFLPGMTWENRDQWHIDHIIPLAKFDLSDLTQQVAAFHYTNLQPLWAADNLRKSDKVQGQNLFGFAYAARIADVESATSTRRRRDGRKHGGDRH